MSEKGFVWLFLLIPAGDLINFIYSQIFQTDINFVSYFLFLTFLIIIRLLLKNKLYLQVLFLSFYFLIYLIPFEGAINNKAREIIPLVLTFAAFYLFSTNIINKDLLENMSKQFTKFILVFVIVYFITVLIKGPSYKSDDFNTRVYLDGFIIAHHYSYYAALFFYYTLFNKKYILSFLLFSSVMIVGSRMGMILIILSILSFLFNNSKNRVKFLISIIIILIIIVNIYLYISPLRQTVSSLQQQNLSDLLSFKDYTIYDSITEGRAYFWFMAFNKIAEQGINSIYFWFGNGPMAAENFLFALTGKPFWMHNDFIQIILCFGFTGFIIYLYHILRFVIFNKSYYFFLFITLTAIFNGFYKYESLQFIIIIKIIDYVISNSKSETIHVHNDQLVCNIQ